MSEPKEIIGALYFSDHEPRIIGQIQIGTVHYDLSGLRRKNGLVELTGRRIARKTPIAQRYAQTQMDMFEDEQ